MRARGQPNGCRSRSDRECRSRIRNDRKELAMSTMHQARRLFFGSTVVFALTLLAPVAVTAEDEVAVMAPVAAPAVVGTSAEDVRATRALAAERALLSGDIGS